MTAVLIVKLGRRRRRVVVAERTTIGRADDAGVRVPYTNASRRHAVIERRGEAYFVRDEGSRNGTYLNGERVRVPLRLRSGDRVTVGDALCVFVEVPDIAAGAEPAWSGDTVVFRCPLCRRKLSATSSREGTLDRCPRCRARFVVPRIDVEVLEDEGDEDVALEPAAPPKPVGRTLDPRPLPSNWQRSAAQASDRPLSAQVLEPRANTGRWDAASRLVATAALGAVATQPIGATVVTIAAPREPIVAPRQTPRDAPAPARADRSWKPPPLLTVREDTGDYLRGLWSTVQGRRQRRDARPRLAAAVRALRRAAIRVVAWPVASAWTSRRILARSRRLASLSDADLSASAASLREAFRLKRQRRKHVREGLALAAEAMRRATGEPPARLRSARAFAAYRGWSVGAPAPGDAEAVAALAAALAGWSGRGCHVVAADADAAREELERLAPAFALLGVSAALVEPGAEPRVRRAAYAADVTYCPRAELVRDLARQATVTGLGSRGTATIVPLLIRRDARELENLVTRGLEWLLVSRGVDAAQVIELEPARRGSSEGKRVVRATLSPTKPGGATAAALAPPPLYAAPEPPPQATLAEFLPHYTRVGGAVKIRR